MKKLIYLLITVTLISCNSSNEKTNQSSSDSLTNSKGKEVELPSTKSSQIFNDITNDEAIASNKYLNKNERISDLIYYDSYVDENKQRVLLCIPYDATENKIGYGKSTIDNTSNPSSESSWMWLSAEQKKLMGAYNYYYNGKKLTPFYNSLDFNMLKNQFVFHIKLTNPEEYSKLSFPDIIKKPDQVYFKNVIKIEGSISELSKRDCMISNCKILAIEKSDETNDNKVKSTRNNKTKSDKVEVKQDEKTQTEEEITIYEEAK